MSFSVGQKILVTDTHVDGKKYLCKIVKLNDEKKN